MAKNFLGLFFNIKFVKLPVPGPTSRIVSSFTLVKLTIRSKIFLSTKNFGRLFRSSFHLFVQKTNCRN